jgi:hypothetical protein
LLHQRPHAFDIIAIVRKRELLGRCVTSFTVIEGVKKVGMLAQCTRNCSQTPHVLRVLPPGVVQPAVAVGDERDSQRTGRRCRYEMKSVAPLTTPAAASDTVSSRISNPRYVTM